VIDSVLWPRLARVLEQYPDVRVEISAEYRMVDIAAERFDIGVRYGDQVQQDMVAVRLTPDIPHDHRRGSALLRDAQGAGDRAGPGAAQLHHAALS
jgi:DNA-binding transcriptional LysR family regulator